MAGRARRPGGSLRERRSVPWGRGGGDRFRRLRRVQSAEAGLVHQPGDVRRRPASLALTLARSRFATVGLPKGSESRAVVAAADKKRTAPVQRRHRRALRDAPRRAESAASGGSNRASFSRREGVARGARVAAGQPLAHGHVPGAGVERAPTHLGDARHENIIRVVVRDVSTSLLLLLRDAARQIVGGALAPREEPFFRGD